MPQRPILRKQFVQFCLTTLQMLCHLVRVKCISDHAKMQEKHINPLPLVRSDLPAFASAQHAYHYPAVHEP